MKILPIGTKVRKRSKKPFKSGILINTVRDHGIHDITGNPVYYFEEDDSMVECRMCRKATENQ